MIQAWLTECSVLTPGLQNLQTTGLTGGSLSAVLHFPSLKAGSGHTDLTPHILPKPTRCFNGCPWADTVEFIPSKLVSMLVSRILVFYLGKTGQVWSWWGTISEFPFCAVVPPLARVGRLASDSGLVLLFRDFHILLHGQKVYPNSLSTQGS